MNKPVDKTRLQPFDIVKIKATGHICCIQERVINTCQESYEGQVSYSIFNLFPDNHELYSNKRAWFSENELDFIGTNLFEILSRLVIHPFNKSAEPLNLKEVRMRP